jgi:glycosyltransferase involved in cell wall biosynthesis
MACGAPICAYRGPGTIDIITHKYNGLLYKNNKNVMKHIKLLMSDSALKQKIINNGLKYIKDKTIKKSVNALYSQYKTLIHKYK